MVQQYRSATSKDHVSLNAPNFVISIWFVHVRPYSANSCAEQTTVNQLLSELRLRRVNAVDEKMRLGDWEVNTIIGKNHRGAIVSAVDRLSKYTFLLRVLRKKKEAVCSALIIQLISDGVPVLTITADNGKEFADHVRVAEKLGTEFYFARPYHSWERGLNEHINGLVRGVSPERNGLPRSI